jgi:hypothetical protein
MGILTPHRLLSVAVCVLLAGTAICAAQDPQDYFESYGSRAKRHSEGAGAPEIVPHRKNAHTGAAPTAGSTGYMTPSIQNVNNGPVMYQPNVYLIWYGNWNKTSGSDTASGQQIIRDFLHGLSGSPYYMINSTYGGVSGFFSVLGEYVDNYSQTSTLSDSRVQAVVSHAISVKALPKDSNGIYFVLTSSDVAESSGFCRQYCGWHTAGTISQTDIKYAFVGNSSRCLSACAAQSVGPNGNAGVDGMISVIAHELEETNTDPDLNAWFDSKGAEDADKCAWTFGANQKKASNGAYYNMTLPGLNGNTRNYLVQRELKSNSKCYVNYDGAQ